MLMIILGLFNFLVKTKEADTHEFEIVHTLDTSDFELGESVELEPFGLYIYMKKKHVHLQEL